MQQGLIDLENASAVTILDHKRVWAKVVATTQKDADSFLVVLEHCTNLFFALFSTKYMLHIQMYSIVKALRDYSPIAQANLSHGKKTSILWIILLQSRWFAQKYGGNSGMLRRESSLTWSTSSRQKIVQQSCMMRCCQN